MQVKVQVKGGTAIVDIPDSMANMPEAEFKRWIEQNIDRDNTRPGTIIPMADPAPMAIQPHNTPYPTPANTPVPAGQVDVEHFFQPHELNNFTTPLPPESEYTGYMRQVPGAILNAPGYIIDNPLTAATAGALLTGVGGARAFREGSVTPANSNYQPPKWYNPKRYFGGGNPDTLRGTQPVIDQFNRTAPATLLPTQPNPANPWSTSSPRPPSPTGMVQNQVNLIVHAQDFAKNYGIKFPDSVDSKIKTGDFTGALDDIYKAIDEHQKTAFSKTLDKIQKNYQQGGAKQVAQKVGQKALEGTKNLPRNAVTAGANLLNKGWGTRTVGGAGLGLILADAATSLANIGHEDYLEESAEEAKKYRDFVKDQGWRVDANSEEYEAIKRLHANPETRHLLFQD